MSRKFNQSEAIVENVINWGAYAANPKARILSLAFEAIAGSRDVAVSDLYNECVTILEEQASHPDFPEAAGELENWKKTLENILTIVLLNR